MKIFEFKSAKFKFLENYYLYSRYNEHYMFLTATFSVYLRIVMSRSGEHFTVTPAVGGREA